MQPISFVERLAETQIGETFNQYAEPRLAARLLTYLERMAAAPLMLVGEAAGHRGARISGIPFTSERQLTGAGPAEATATIVHSVLSELGVEARVLLWNVVPTHPHRPGRPGSNRRPTRLEVADGLLFVRELARGRRTIAVGRVAEAALEVPAVRHPSHGGARDFRAGLAELLHD